MKYAIISDIHSNQYGLKQILNAIEKEKVDHFILLGDYITDGLFDNQVLSFIKKHQKYAIKGNRETAILHWLNVPTWNGYLNAKPLYDSSRMINEESKKTLLELPSTCTFTDHGVRILLLHGKEFGGINSRNSAGLTSLMKKYDFDICLSGHTHTQHDFYVSHYHFINPGSAGLASDGSDFCYGILEITDEVTYRAYRIPVAPHYAKIHNAFITSDYYRNNPIYCNLFLGQLRTGTDYLVPFIKLIHRNLPSKQYVTPAVFNQIWQELGIRYLEKKH